MHSPLLSQLCNQAHSRHWVTAITPVEICLSETSTAAVM